MKRSKFPSFAIIALIAFLCDSRASTITDPGVIIQMNGGNASLTWNATAIGVADLEHSEDLISWSLISQNNTMGYLLHGTGGATKGFYRLRPKSDPGGQVEAPSWAWVRKIDSGAFDDKVAGLALVEDGVWIGGETYDQHFIQKFGFDGQPASNPILLGPGDSVNALVAGPDGRLFGAADIWTNEALEHRPAWFFEGGTQGLLNGLVLGTSSPNGTVGYGDAYGIDYYNGAVYLSGYVDPASWTNPNIGYFRDKVLDLSGKNVPPDSYALFIAKILPGASSSANATVEWVKYGGLEIGEAIKVSSEGIFVAGDDGYIRRFSSNGELIWEVMFPTHTDYSTYSIALEVSGGLWVGGDGSGVLHKFNTSTGAVEESLAIPGVVSLMGLCAHPEGGLVVNAFGAWQVETDREAGYRIYRILGDGTISWNKHITAGWESRSTQSKVAVATTGEIYVAFTAGETSRRLTPEWIFPEVKFEGFSETFPFAPYTGTAKGFLAVLKFE